MSFRPALKPLAEKGQCVPCKPGERELNVVQEAEHGAQFHSERTSSCDQPNCFRRESESESSTNSRYSFFRGRERSLDSGRLQRSFRHSRMNGASPPKLTAAFGFEVELKERKDISHLSFPHRVPQQGSALVSQSFSEPMVLQIRHPQTPIARTLTADLFTNHQLSMERDCFSANRITGPDQGFCLGGCICHKRNVISVVRVHNRSCGVSSASCLCQSRAIFFH